MSTLMFTRMGVSLASSIGSFISASAEADLDRKIQTYQNTISKLSAARQKNAITTNEVRSRDAAVRADVSIQQQSIIDQGQQRVKNAAAGVEGKTIDLLMDDLKASEGKARYAQQRNLNQRLSDMGEKRTSVAIGAITSQDVQVNPKPSIGSALLGAGTDLLRIYDESQPEGSRLLGLGEG